MTSCSWGSAGGSGDRARKLNTAGPPHLPDSPEQAELSVLLRLFSQYRRGGRSEGLVFKSLRKETPSDSHLLTLGLGSRLFPVPFPASLSPAGAALNSHDREPDAGQGPRDGDSQGHGNSEGLTATEAEGILAVSDHTLI